MQLSLAGFWQLSPLTDLSIPQEDLCFPGPLSSALPVSLDEASIAEQEWHLMHDIEVDEHLLSYPAIDLVLEGIDYHAEIRLNGVALFDCDGTQAVYKKEIRALLNLGKNRIEILFLYPEEDLLIDKEEVDQCLLGKLTPQRYDERMGIWREPYLQCIRHVRLEHVTTEQIWHYGGGCELLITLFFKPYAAGLISASVRFDHVTYQLPIDIRSDQVSALFQVEAPKHYQPESPDPNDLYPIKIELDGQKIELQLGLSEHLSVTHFPL
ncbi:glycosyl hydrolase 2 galactose-binding domain-containing protein [Vibrio cincinnatiensis]|uniref:glycosyl hydrolase 2 galactose-binding domain-containing protein n=1 Tax=Vibrio cincinnatiensis TaxID=675 RepID=UPI001EDFA061|nr:hypothetical protein [Vibrio cincinnatiensis]MCG3730113.1 hypothetical protein [Vibrio cincinnatiensis]